MTARSHAAKVWGRVSARLQTWRKFWNGVIGADKYEKYLAHHRATGCEKPPLSEREFWREHTDRQEQNPQGRCC